MADAGIAVRRGRGGGSFLVWLWGRGGGLYDKSMFASKGMQMVCYKKACEPKTCAVVPRSFPLEALSGNSG